MICYPQVEFPPVSEEEFPQPVITKKTAFRSIIQNRIMAVSKEQTCIPAGEGRLEQEEMSVLEWVSFRERVYRKANHTGCQSVFLCRTALCDSRGDAEKSDEKRSSDGAGESEKIIFLYSMTNFLVGLKLVRCLKKCEI